MEAKSQWNVYNKAVIVLISSILSLWSIHFPDLVQKVTKWLTIINYFRLMLWIAFTLLNTNFSSLNSLGTCVHDMKSYPIPAVESSKIHNGFDKAGFRFQTHKLSLSHTYLIGFIWQWKASNVLLIYVLFNHASNVSSCYAISEHNVLAI